METILESRKGYLYQYDKNQAILLQNPAVVGVHLALRGEEEAFVMDCTRTEAGLRCAIPQALCDDGRDLVVYAMYADGTYEVYTVFVRRRAKPMDWTPPADWTPPEDMRQWSQMVARVQELTAQVEQAVANLDSRTDDLIRAYIEAHADELKGAPGSDATVTTENIEAALGYSVTPVVALTSSEYNALPVKDAETLYLIKEA